MYRIIRALTICYILLATVLFMPVNSLSKKPYTTGIADIVRLVFQRGYHHFIFGQTPYDSDVFRYTQLTHRGGVGLYAGESCRLSSTICSRDEQCCSGRCICRRWLITGEERCVRKCF